MKAGEGEYIDATQRFQDKRTPKRPAAADDAVAEVIPFPILGVPPEKLERLTSTYDKVVKPILTVLEEAGYTVEMHELSEYCVEALWADQTEQDVQAIAETRLQNIDPELHAFFLHLPPDAS